MIFAAVAIAACALDESGTPDSGAPDVFAPDVTPGDGGLDVGYDVPDLGVGETESGLPCTCVTSVPSGYAVVEYDPTQQPACSPGYDASTPLDEVLSAPPAQCSCQCGAVPTTPPSCSCGTDPATFTIHGGQSDCTGYTNQSLQASTGSCYTTSQALPVTGNGADYLLAIPTAPCVPGGGTCGAGVPSQSVPDASIAQGRACDIASPTGSCNGGVCLPTPGSGYELCITAHDASTSCAAFTDFPEQHLVGDGVSDSRGCNGTCGCGFVDAGSCGSPVVELWNNSGNCNGTPDVVLDAGCTNARQGNNPTFQSAHYDVPHSGGACGTIGAYNPTGGAVVTNRYVICCRP
ncbi:MAG TPA: hypothetical protein VGH28_14380 [Polyangiaceae bacterium]